jgi:hypothetical protein
MVTGDMIVAMTDAIKQKVQSFCESRDFSRLTPELAEEMAGGIKQAISLAGAMGYQAFLKSYEVHEPSLEVGGEEYRFKRPVEKRYVTPFGPMILPRNMFQNKSDTKTHFPLDVAWGMVGEFMTVEVREAVLFSSAFVTPEETKTLLEKSALFEPSATAIKHVLAQKGKLIGLHKDELDTLIRLEEEVPRKTRVLAGSLDGANVLLNEKGVKRGRPSERPTGEQRTITPTAYKNAMVGSISFYGEVPEGERTPQRLACHYTAHMPEDHAPTFKAQFEAEMRDAQDKCEPGVVKLLLLDGARPLWNYVDNTPLYDDYEKGIDYFHTLEHLSKAGEALFGKDSTPAKAWYDKYRKILLENDMGAQSVIRSIDYHANTRKLSRASRKDLDTQRTFFRRNRHRMNYADFRRRGLPIGSGPVEAACKTLVKARLCRSGMRWSRQGGQHVLDLRTYVKSNRWDAAWKKIKTLLKVA